VDVADDDGAQRETSMRAAPRGAQGPKVRQKRYASLVR
jgi:hypothetical protein